MANKILIKRSNLAGGIPTTGQLDLGELAINTYDGRLYAKKNDGTASIVDLTQNDPIRLLGDASSTYVYDQSTHTSNVTLTLNTVNTNVGTFGGIATGVITVPQITVDAKGRITAVTTSTFNTVGELGTMSSQNANNVSITGGTIDGTVIGGTTAADGTFTNLTVENSVTLESGVTVTGDLDVTGSQNLSGDLAVTGNISVGGKLFSNDITASNVTVDGDAVITGNLTVQGVTTTVNSTTVAVGDLNITLAKDAQSSAQANGAGITILGPTTPATLIYDGVNDSWTVNKDFVAEGGVDVGSDLGVSGSATISGGITVSDAASFGNTVNVTDSVTVGTSLDVGTSATIGSTLDVTGNTTVTGSLNANGGINADDGKFTVANNTGDVYTAGTLQVNGDSTLSSNVTVEGNLIVKQRSFLENDLLVSTITGSGGSNGTYSVLFDGVNDTASIPASADLDILNGSYTIEFWFNANDLTSNGTIVSKYSDPFSPASGYYIAVSSSSVSVYLNGFTSRPYSFSTSTWYHVAVSVTNNVGTLYVNGQAQGSTFNAGVDNSVGHPLAFGYRNGSTPGLYFNGYISNLRIVKGVAIYTSNFTPPTEELQVTNETELLTFQLNGFADASTNNFTITPNGATVDTLGPFAVVPPTYSRVETFIVDADSGDVTALGDITTTETVSAGVVSAGTVEASIIKDSSLTAGRIVLATTDGELTDDAELTYDSSTDTLSLQNLEVGSNVHIVGTLTVDSQIVVGNLVIDGETDLGGAVTVTGVSPTQVVYADSSGALSGDAGLVYNDATNTLTIGNVSVTGSFGVTGAATLSSTLDISGLATFLSGVSLTATTTYTPGDYTTGVLAIAGDVSIAKNLQVQTDIRAAGTIYKAGNEVLSTVDTIDGGSY